MPSTDRPVVSIHRREMTICHLHVYKQKHDRVEALGHYTILHEFIELIVSSGFSIRLMACLLVKYITFGSDLHIVLERCETPRPKAIADSHGCNLLHNLGETCFPLYVHIRYMRSRRESKEKIIQAVEKEIPC